MQLTKKDLITKLIDAARKAGNANPLHSALLPLTTFA